MAAISYTATRGLSLLGDEVGAWMADTTAETLVGSELVTNGTFDTVTTGWAAGNSATLSIASAKLRVAYNGSGNPYAYQAVATVVGETYQIVADGTYSTAAFNIGVGIAAGVANLYVSANKVASEAGILGSFVATGTLSYVRLLTIGTSGYVDFDNVSVRLAVPDLSTANNGLGVYGSITKAAVATGADLVGYSGFSASNYLEQPYNADLDFGTGDFCYMGWFKELSTQANKGMIFQRTDGAGSTWGTVSLACQLTTGGFLYVNIAGATSTGTIDYRDDLYHHLAISRVSGVAYVSVDGALITSFAAAGSITDTSGVLRFGVTTYNSNISTLEMIDGAIALWRAFDYAPTAAQIKAIYDKEKHLFNKHSYYTQEGVEYSFDLKTTQKNRSSKTAKNDSTTISGKVQSVVHRDDYEWSLSSKLMHRTETTDHINLHQFREYIYSTRGSEEHTLDPYGTVASPDEPVSVIRLGSSVAEAEEQFTDYFRASIQLREVE